MIIERKLLNDAWRAYRAKHMHLKEYNFGSANFALYLGVDRNVMNLWLSLSTGKTAPPHLALDLSPLQVSKLHVLINSTPDNVWIMTKTAIAKHRTVDE